VPTSRGTDGPKAAAVVSYKFANVMWALVDSLFDQQVIHGEADPYVFGPCNRFLIIRMLIVVLGRCIYFDCLFIQNGRERVENLRILRRRLVAGAHGSTSKPRSWRGRDKAQSVPDRCLYR